jgi:hypothetical protein
MSVMVRGAVAGSGAGDGVTGASSVPVAVASGASVLTGSLAAVPGAAFSVFLAVAHCDHYRTQFLWDCAR